MAYAVEIEAACRACACRVKVSLAPGVESAPAGSAWRHVQAVFDALGWVRVDAPGLTGPFLTRRERYCPDCSGRLRTPGIEP